MEMPKPNENHARLAAFAGRWTGEEKIHPSPWDPQGGTATARVETRLACDGFCIVTDYVEERHGRVNYVGHGVTGYDPQHRRYLQHWSDSVSGMPPDAKPGVWDGDTLTFHGAGPAGRTRYVYRVTGPDSYDFRIENSRDGNVWGPFVEARYVREKAKPKARPKRAKKAKKKAKPKKRK
jgi:hypothetical protein